MAYSEDKALSALQSVTDPLTGKDIVASGRLGDLAFQDGILRAVLLIDPKRADAYADIPKQAEAALSELDGVTKASVILTAHKAAPQLTAPQLTAQKGKRPVRPHQARRPEGYQGDSQIKTVIAVSSAKGGVGKSTVAVGLATALAAQGLAVGLLDADIHGPSAPILLGLKGERPSTLEVQGRRLIAPLTAHGIKAMSIGFLTDDDGPVVWRGPMVQGAISKMLWDVNWGALDILIIDMPPGTGDAQLGLAQDIKPRAAVIVSTPQDLALADARKGVGMFKKVDIPILGLIENMSLFVCPNCGEASHIFGTGGAETEAKTLGVPFLGAVPLHIDIREQGDAGTPDSARFAPIAEAVMTALDAYA